MRLILSSLLTFLVFNLNAQTKEVKQIDKNKVFNENLLKICNSLNKNDVISIRTYFEPKIFSEFNSTHNNSEERKGAANILKVGQVIDQSSNKKMISGYGYQIHFIFKKDKWVINYWDIFSSD